MDTKTFEVLFTNDKRGKPKQWSISVVNNGAYSNILTRYGGVNYRKIESTLQISQGKNLGKNNATTHFEQAVKDAGKYRVEGKEYVVKDGDVLFFRFNV